MQKPPAPPLDSSSPAANRNAVSRLMKLTALLLATLWLPATMHCEFELADVAFLTPVRRIQLPVNARFKVALGFEEDVKEVDFCEMERATLARRMREVASGTPGERRHMSEAGVAVASERFTWERSVARVVECLDELDGPQGEARIFR